MTEAPMHIGPVGPPQETVKSPITWEAVKNGGLRIARRKRQSLPGMIVGDQTKGCQTIHTPRTICRSWETHIHTKFRYTTSMDIP